MVWVRMSPGRRILVGAVGALMLLLFGGVLWLDIQAGRTGMIDMGIMGATLAGGGMAAFFAILGKEQRRAG